jgi:hypothetical protein
MHWLFLAAFIAAHFLAYFAVFRHFRAFASERAIAVYHGLGFVLVLVIVTVAWARGTIGFAGWCGLLALEYLYSLSFLELWTLAEGSYSLQILRRVSQEGSPTREDIVAMCEAIGAKKKDHRLDDLLAFGLIAVSTDGRLTLSTAGTMLVRALRAIMRTTTIHDAG